MKASEKQVLLYAAILSIKRSNAFWGRRTKVGICPDIRTSRQLLAVLQDESVTQGMKSILPSAAVENIGQ